jgi:RNA polymerase sigma factor (sigma-70 family)
MQTASPNQLVIDHLKYAEALTVDVIDQFNLRPLINLDEALSFANTALTEAAQRFQPKLGRTGRAVPFTTFSFSRIRGAVIDGIRQSRRSRHEFDLHVAARKTLEQRTAPFPADVPRNSSTKRHPNFESAADASRSPAFTREAERALHEETLHALAARDAIAKAIGQLPEIEQQVIFLHYYEDMSCERLAPRLGISSSYALRLRNNALQSLRKLLKDFDADSTEGAVQ